LAIPSPGSPDGALPLDGTFGLHPSLGFLHERFLDGELIVFQAVASPYLDPTHRHRGWLAQPPTASLPRRFATERERTVAISQNAWPRP
jgi:hypothetical protein